uniref:Uncharacterized protein n=1 Tax=Arundo donax TaxID=35708 RepID=A0A0A9CGB7_ARUDO
MSLDSSRNVLVSIEFLYVQVKPQQAVAKGEERAENIIVHFFSLNDGTRFSCIMCKSCGMYYPCYAVSAPISYGRR